MTLALPAFPTWMTRAACAGEPIETFFPPPGHPNLADRALAICKECPVVAECRDFGLHDDYGIFGGLTDDERRALRPAGKRPQSRWIA